MFCTGEGYAMALTVQGKACSCAREVRVEAHEVEAVLGHVPAPPCNAESCRWFNRHWLAASISGKLLCVCCMLW